MNSSIGKRMAVTFDAAADRPQGEQEACVSYGPAHTLSPVSSPVPVAGQFKADQRTERPMPRSAERPGASQKKSGRGEHHRKDKRPKRDVHGWLVLDKPVGMTSTHAVSVVKRLFQAKRVGHAGTLDPLASGLLPIAFGEATKTVMYVMDGRKHYRFTVRWGEERDTDDAEGRVISTSEARPTLADIEAALPPFIGTIEQVPPQFSAIKVEGERAYDIAREGAAVELKARTIEMHRLVCVGQPDPDHAEFVAECGKGAYVRAVARDIGRALGCYGHVSALRRTAVGPFAESDMIPLAQVEALCDRAAVGEANLADALMPVATALDDIPALAVSRADAAKLQRGHAVLMRGRDAPIVRGTVYVTVAGQLLALAELDRGEIVPKRVFNLAGLQGRAGRQQGV